MLEVIRLGSIFGHTGGSFAGLVYHPYCRNPYGKPIAHHGFKTPEDAFYQYKKDKESVIKKVADDEYSKGKITKKCYEAMINYEVSIND